MEQEMEIRNIQKATLNGKQVKIFEIWQYRPDVQAWLFYDRTSRPAKIANKNLLNEYLK